MNSVFNIYMEVSPNPEDIYCNSPNPEEFEVLFDEFIFQSLLIFIILAPALYCEKLSSTQP